MGVCVGVILIYYVYILFFLLIFQNGQGLLYISCTILYFAQSAVRVEYTDSC